ncbi:MAG: hypothetical protein IKH36_01755 [Bacilli bacterium]|nr:hypothetical protein [Bacilli bacterium]
MTDIATNLDTIDDSLSDIKTSIVNKGVTPSGNITTFATAIDNIPSGGGSSGKYQLLERVKDDNNNEIGTVSGFFTDANNVEYAVVCLDAQYRLVDCYYCSNTNTAVTDLPVYATWAIWEAKETAMFNTQKILDFCAANGYTSTACTHCRSKSFTIDGVTYYGQLPNIAELVDICKNYTAIQSADTSVSQYSSLGFPRTLDRIWSSSQYSSSISWTVSNLGSANSGNKTSRYFVAPVLEIPNAV